MLSGCTKGTTPEKTQELLRKRAELEMDSFIGASEQYEKDNGTLPAGPDGLYGKEAYLLQQRVLDPWDNRYKYTFATNRVAMESAGPDRHWGTDDDLHRK